MELGGRVKGNVSRVYRIENYYWHDSALPETTPTVLLSVNKTVIRQRTDVMAQV